jgi:hypothetical protein
MTKAIFITAILIVAPLLASRAVKGAPLDLRTMLASPVDLTVYSPDRKLVIGHSHYTITENGNAVEILGNTHYSNGERDWERIMLGYEPGNPLPVVTSFQANFLASDDSPQLMEKADFKTGQASCRWHSQFDDNTYDDTLEFGPDTYAGASSIIPLEYSLKKGESTVRFHDFDCTPKPAIYTVEAKLEDGAARWSFYPGELNKMGLTPDLGWLNLVARPFIPDISVWFDPGESYQYVGASKDRFYRGRQIVLVRNHSGRQVGAESAQEAAPANPSSDHHKARN